MTKMEEGELYAIETFGSTGRGYVVEDLACSHYMKVFGAACPLRIRKRSNCFDINAFDTLAFCPRWLERPDGGSQPLHGDQGKQPLSWCSQKSAKNGIVRGIPLCDIKEASPNTSTQSCTTELQGSPFRGHDYKRFFARGGGLVWSENRNRIKIQSVALPPFRCFILIHSFALKNSTKTSGAYRTYAPDRSFVPATRWRGLYRIVRKWRLLKGPSKILSPRNSYR